MRSACAQSAPGAKLLADAGWRHGRRRLVGQRRRPAAGIRVFTYTRTFERVAAPYQRNLEKLGVKLNVRMVDPALFQNGWSSLIST